MRVGFGRQIAVICNEIALARPAQRQFHNGMASGLDHKRAAVVDFRADPTLTICKIGKGCRKVQFGQGFCGLRQWTGLVKDRPSHLFENAFFDVEGMAAGIQDLGFHFRQGQRREAHLIGSGLAMNECFRQRRGHHSVGVGRGCLDKITKYVVVLDLKRGHT